MDSRIRLRSTRVSALLLVAVLLAMSSCKRRAEQPSKPPVTKQVEEDTPTATGVDQATGEQKGEDHSDATIKAESVAESSGPSGQANSAASDSASSSMVGNTRVTITPLAPKAIGDASSTVTGANTRAKALSDGTPGKAAQAPASAPEVHVPPMSELLPDMRQGKSTESEPDDNKIPRSPRPQDPKLLVEKLLKDLEAKKKGSVSGAPSVNAPPPVVAKPPIPQEKRQ